MKTSLQFYLFVVVAVWSVTRAGVLPACEIIGDTDCDGIVTISDWKHVNAWMGYSLEEVTDLHNDPDADNDGDIDLHDLMATFNNLGRGGIIPPSVSGDADFTIRTDIVTAFDPANNYAEIVDFDPSQFSPIPLLVQVDFYLDVAPPLASLGFGAVRLNIDVAGADDQYAFGPAPSVTIETPEGDVDLGLFTNLYGGVYDLDNIMLINNFMSRQLLGSGPFPDPEAYDVLIGRDPRRPNEVLGNIFVLWDGASSASIGTEVVDASMLILPDYSQEYYDRFYVEDTNPVLRGSTIRLGLVGDVDGNGEVALADFNLVLDNFGRYDAQLPYDTNGDGVIGLSEFNAVLDSMGMSDSTISQLTAVPEPNSITLVALGLAYLALISRKPAGREFSRS